MAIFRLQIQSIGRSAARSATAAAAYRSGERVWDERSGQLFNYSRRKDVVHKEIFVPSRVEGPSMDWARDRNKLWNAAEHAEPRRHARVAREFQVALPSELNAEQRLGLARTFSREVADRYNVAVDLAIHDPKTGSDPRNFHAHLLTTTREVTPNGMGARTGLDMSPRERDRLQLPSIRDEYVAIRERWATLTNEALRDAKLDARVDHRAGRPPTPSPNVAHIQQSAKEAWQRLRQPEAQSGAAQDGSTRLQAVADKDHSL